MLCSEPISLLWKVRGIDYKRKQVMSTSCMACKCIRETIELTCSSYYNPSKYTNFLFALATYMTANAAQPRKVQRPGLHANSYACMLKIKQACLIYRCSCMGLMILKENYVKNLVRYMQKRERGREGATLKKLWGQTTPPISITTPKPHQYFVHSEQKIVTWQH